MTVVVVVVDVVVVVLIVDVVIVVDVVVVVVDFVVVVSSSHFSTEGSAGPDMETQALSALSSR